MTGGDVTSIANDNAIFAGQIGGSIARIFNAGGLCLLHEVRAIGWLD